MSDTCSWNQKLEECQHLEDLCKSVNQYFPSDQCMILQNHAWVGEKDPFNVQERQIDVIIGEYRKATDMVSESYCT